MGIIRWDGSLSVGVDDMDMQHQRLFAMIDELNDAMLQRKGQDLVGKIISGLAEYTKTHFQIEERHLQRANYPDLAAHKREHAVFVAKVEEYESAFRAGRLGLSVEVMNFLTGWLKNHIQVTDKKYGAALNAAGIR